MDKLLTLLAICYLGFLQKENKDLRENKDLKENRVHRASKDLKENKVLRVNRVLRVSKVNKVIAVSLYSKAFVLLEQTILLIPQRGVRLIHQFLQILMACGSIVYLQVMENFGLQVDCLAPMVCIRKRANGLLLGR